MQIANPTADAQTRPASIQGLVAQPSAIGTTSPNTGSTAATNSSYAPGAYTSGISEQDTATSYELNNTDYQGIIVFNTSSMVMVMLNSAVRDNFQATILNLSTGAITLTTSDSSPINSGSDTLAIPSGQGVQVFYSESSWWAYTATTIMPVIPVNTPPVESEWLASYNASTGAFTQTRPVFSDISGNLDSGQLPAGGVSGTFTLAALTALGTQGSITMVDGQVTSFTPST